MRISAEPEVVQKFLEAHESTLLKSGTTIGELVRRPELDYEDVSRD